MHRRGFTLIEMMITVAVVAILASIAYPSYMQYVVRANRSAVQQFMLDIANREEQFMLDSRNYTNLVGLNLSIPPEVTGKYTVTVVPNNAATPPSFTITATAIGSQAANSDDDTVTGRLTLDSSGIKGPAAKWK